MVGEEVGKGLGVKTTAAEGVVAWGKIVQLQRLSKSINRATRYA